MDGAASIVAFVSVGLKSIKVVYDVISAIKDGPEKLRDLQTALFNLQTLLRNLEQDQTLLPPSKAALVQRCSDDIGRFKDKVVALRISDDDKIHGRFWKKLKMAFKEKEIPYILSVVNGHAAALGAHLVVRQSATLTELGARQTQFHMATMAAMDKHYAFGDRGIADMQSRQATTHDTIVHHHDSHTASLAGMAAQQKTTYDTMVHHHLSHATALADMASRQTTTHEAVVQQRSVQQAMLAEFQRSVFHQLEVLSQTTKHSFNEAMQSNMTQMTSTLAAMGISSPRFQNKDSGTNDDNHEDHTEYLTNLEVLAKLVEAGEKRLIASENAGCIADAMEAILQSLRRALRSVAPEPHGIYGPNIAKMMAMLRKMGGHFADAPSVHLNPQRFYPGKRIDQRLVDVEGTEISWETRHGGLQSKRCNVSIITSLLLGDDGEQEQGSRTDMILLSRHGSSPGGIVLKSSVTQALRYSDGARILLTPMVSIYRMVPYDSEVFRCVLEDRPEDLILLISNGRASLRDRDEYGASLLHYACSSVMMEHRPPQLAMCRFLVENGAEMDDLAEVCHLYNYMGGPSMDFPVEGLFAHFDNPGKVEGSYKCLVYLRDQGADLSGDVLLLALGLKGAASLLRALLPALRSTVDINKHYFRHRSVLGHACCNLECVKIQTLVEGGLDPNGVDSSGRSPLIYLMTHSHRWHATSLEALKSVKYLIEKGANVHATWEGSSCSAIAYARDENSDCSLVGDVWDAALAATGHDVGEFREREGCHHRAKYGTLYGAWVGGVFSYGLDTFKPMWEGMEDRCPYYHEAVSGMWEEGSQAHVEELEDDSASEWETASEAGSI